MTNEEKYREVFGLTVDPSMCPTTDCNVCPCVSKDTNGDISCVSLCTYEWWKSEYKGSESDEMTQDLIDKVNVNVGLAQPIKDERPQGGAEC